jgi:hypothetical protein
MTRTVLAGLFVAALPFAIARADRGNDRRPPPHPPQAAIDACASKAAGDACTVSLGEHSMSGTCAALPDAGTLACRPDHPPGPPPEAFEACSGKSAGDACSVTHDGHTLGGSCSHGPHGDGPLACKPDGAPPHP